MNISALYGGEGRECPVVAESSLDVSPAQHPLVLWSELQGLGSSVGWEDSMVVDALQTLSFDTAARHNTSRARTRAPLRTAVLARSAHRHPRRLLHPAGGGSLPARAAGAATERGRGACERRAPRPAHPGRAHDKHQFGDVQRGALPPPL